MPMAHISPLGFCDDEIGAVSDVGEMGFFSVEMRMIKVVYPRAD